MIEGIVDFRVQPPYESFLGMHFYRDRSESDDPDVRDPFGEDREITPSMRERSMDLFIEEMSAAGIDHAVIMGQRADPRWGQVSNEDIAHLVQKYAGLFSGFGGVDPSDDDAVAQIDRIVGELGLSGIAIIPGWSAPPLGDDDAVVMRCYERAALLGVPVVVTSSHYIGSDMASSHPVHLQHVVEAYPDLKLVVGHGAWPWTTACTALAMRYPNVYLMPDFYMYTPNMPGAADYVAAANSFLRDRMLYSSCYPSRSLGEARSLFERLDLGVDARKRAMADNGRSLLGLS